MRYNIHNITRPYTAILRFPQVGGGFGLQDEEDVCRDRRWREGKGLRAPRSTAILGRGCQPGGTEGVWSSGAA